MRKLRIVEPMNPVSSPDDPETKPLSPRVQQLVVDIHKAFDLWMADNPGPGSYKGINIPLDALPYLQRIWTEDL